MNFLQKFGFEGLSFEWLYPKCWQSQCSKGPVTDRPNFTKLLQELRKEFDAARPKLTLAVAVSGYKEIIDVAYDFPQISDAADFISVMTYDYHGAWEKQVGHLSPLYGRPGEQHAFYNTVRTPLFFSVEKKLLFLKRQKLTIHIKKKTR